MKKHRWRRELADYIPAKYRERIMVDDNGRMMIDKDEDGVWFYLTDDWVVASSNANICHGDNINDALRELRNTIPTPEWRKEQLAKINDGK